MDCEITVGIKDDAAHCRNIACARDRNSGALCIGFVSLSQDLIPMSP